MPVYESTWYGETIDQENYSAASSNYYLSWNVYNDAEHLLIDLRTEHRPSIMKITRMGFQVFVDPSGKKNETLGITYPIKPTRKPQEGSERSRQGQRGSGRRPSGRGSGEGADLSRLLEHMPKRFLINAVDGNRSESIDNLPEGYEARITIENGVLHYFLKLPIKDFSELADLSELSIGFLSGASDMNMMGNRAGGRPGGGPPSGAGGASPMASQMAEMADPIKVWFKVDLASSHE